MVHINKLIIHFNEFKLENNRMAAPQMYMATIEMLNELGLTPDDIGIDHGQLMTSDTYERVKKCSPELLKQVKIPDNVHLTDDMIEHIRVHYPIIYDNIFGDVYDEFDGIAPLTREDAMTTGDFEDTYEDVLTRENAMTTGDFEDINGLSCVTDTPPPTPPAQHSTCTVIDFLDELQHTPLQNIKPLIDKYDIYYSNNQCIARMTPSDFEYIVNKHTRVTEEQSNVLKLKPSTYIVGDIHGNRDALYKSICDAIDILIQMSRDTPECPADITILFLGDIVDRGPASIQCLLLVMMLQIAFPKNVYYIRGNHETRRMASMMGLLAQIRYIYDEPTIIFDHIVRAFSYLPLCAVIDGKIFCVHGGIPPDNVSINDIEQLDRVNLGDDTYDSSVDDLHTYWKTPLAIVSRLMWSDPTKMQYDVEYGIPSDRNPPGCYKLQNYNETNSTDFLEKNDLIAIVRGHQLTPSGYEFTHSGKVVTIHSAPGVMRPTGVVTLFIGDMSNGIDRSMLRFL